MTANLLRNVGPERTESGSVQQRAAPAVPRAGAGDMNSSLADPLTSLLSHCTRVTASHSGLPDKNILKDKDELIRYKFHYLKSFLRRPPPHTCPRWTLTGFSIKPATHMPCAGLQKFGPCPTQIVLDPTSENRKTRSFEIAYVTQQKSTCQTADERTCEGEGEWQNESRAAAAPRRGSGPQAGSGGSPRELAACTCLAC